MNDSNSGCQKLWAPWRMKYIEGSDPASSGGCIFCEKPAEHDDEKNYIIFRGKTCFVILNIFPYNNGHLMVVPYRHTANLDDLGPDERLEIMDLTALVIRAMKSIMRPDGFNIGMNMGRSAGAGIDEHLHMHIVPRWNGDTNFMPIIGSAKVICESLEDTARKLGSAIEAISDRGEHAPGGKTGGKEKTD
jgi:ATP adenylyltransferase